jgi:hypothetical protein
MSEICRSSMCTEAVRCMPCDGAYTCLCATQQLQENNAKLEKKIAEMQSRGSA